MRFEPSNVEVLNLGTSDAAIIVGYEPQSAANREAKVQLVSLGPGDHEFLRHVRQTMRPQMAAIGERLLNAVRARFPGNLEQSKRKPHKFVEKPNFWTIKIQPRDESYYVTVRGKPHLYRDSPFKIKSEMATYSRFYVRAESEIPEALRLISLAKHGQRNTESLA